MSSIQDVQNEIIGEFEILGDDKESTIFYIMELGSNLPEFPDTERKDENIIKGCQSKVWLTAGMKEDKIQFLADSNTDITKGLISLLIRVLSGRTPQEIINAELSFIDKIGMGNIIGSQRSNGLAAMIKQMKLYALAYQAKQNA
ncbi:Sulfur acceptor protein SufE for iron-sulfur cluster assembly [Indibacter alkaliphilus LW1]|jgi:cysteine desulfuration protein SufE|uniref:Sulfur acceptor protein SufE for iron-sulfur cluster assembly n=1 Tax=Indibacter alkaliphilus (strain CCUG 57479 / KCTC 22604 / LW1) TaxID=1189612 RepID=S2D6B8_INDAL|nr:SufE family protein [Indibacter alkaliphilus]EOZ92605.1 Sulfur acceptor protein SufE for iron-sulfur cluster assembly [Indibacter alkaliphilus LW1]